MLLRQGVPRPLVAALSWNPTAWCAPRGHVRIPSAAGAVPLRRCMSRRARGSASRSASSNEDPTQRPVDGESKENHAPPHAPGSAETRQPSRRRGPLPHQNEGLGAVAVPVPPPIRPTFTLLGTELPNPVFTFASQLFLREIRQFWEDFDPEEFLEVASEVRQELQDVVNSGSVERLEAMEESMSPEVYEAFRRTLEDVQRTPPPRGAEQILDAWDANWLRQSLAEDFVVDPAATLLLPNGVHGVQRDERATDREYIVMMSAQFDGSDGHVRNVHTHTFSSPLCSFDASSGALESAEPAWKLVRLDVHLEEEVADKDRGTR